MQMTRGQAIIGRARPGRQFGNRFNRKGGLGVGYLLNLTRKQTWGRNLQLDVYRERELCLGSVVLELNRRQTRLRRSQAGSPAGEDTSELILSPRVVITDTVVRL